jgi:hypothetical protein
VCNVHVHKQCAMELSRTCSMMGNLWEASRSFIQSIPVKHQFGQCSTNAQAILFSDCLVLIEGFEVSLGWFRIQ